MARKIYEIAADIQKNWPKVNYAAVPYLKAMHQLSSINDYFHADDARSVLTYFLTNAGTWRGEHARRIKAEIKELAGIK